MPVPDQPLFAHFPGIELVSVSLQRVTAKLAMREDFKNHGGEMHGGALMAFADNLGGTTANAKPARGPAHRDDREQDQRSVRTPFQR